jgi:hypothetical protein
VNERLILLLEEMNKEWNKLFKQTKIARENVVEQKMGFALCMSSECEWKMSKLFLLKRV